MRWRFGTLVLGLMLLGSSEVRATDTWTEVAPGIDQLHRTTAAPQDYHVVLVDLTRPEIWLRATGPGENGQRTSAFASSVGATVAINGDLWDANNWSAYEPLGLAVGDGWGWRDDTNVWSFFACDVTKACWFDPWGSLVESSPRWFNAVGGMQDLLVIDGVGQSYSAAFYTERHPRTAIGLTADGGTLILLVVDGRRPGSALGMSFAELTAVMIEFGAYNAMNNDGGGSSTLYASGSVQNIPSDGSERVVANHLGIMVSGQTDPNCVGVENSRLCIDGQHLRTCTGGLDRGLGDCGVYGLTCEDDGLFGYCVDPRCVNGGQQSQCLDDTRIGICEDGVYREGDCAGFGLPCVEGFDTAWCWADFYQAEPSSSSLGGPAGGALDVTEGEEPTIWFELRNTGLTTWTAGVIKLAPVPRDADSLLAASSWLDSQRIATVETDVPPGELGRFTFTLAPPSPGQYDLALGLVAEGVTWFADPPSGGGPTDGLLHLTITVGDASGVDAGTSNNPDAGPDDVDPPDDSGCGCTTSGNAPTGGLIGLLLWVILRRRQSHRR
jgi:uncharacterized protein (TIGR03382 family)